MSSPRHRHPEGLSASPATALVLRGRAFALVALGALLATTPALAADPAPAPKPAAKAAPAPASLLENLDAPEGNNGEWAEYALLFEGKPQLQATVRVVLVPDPVDGQVWFEMWLDKTGRNAVRARDGSPVLMKMGSAVFEMPHEKKPEEPMCSAPGGCHPMTPDERADAKKHPESLRLEPLKVVAGTFRCQKTVRGAGENKVTVWKSEEVPGIHMVRALYPEGHGFELVAFGKNGRSSFPDRYQTKPFPFADTKNLERLIPSVPKTPPAPAGGEPQKEPAAAPEAAGTCDPKSTSCPPASPATP